jgi:hypothetical protein
MNLLPVAATEQPDTLPAAREPITRERTPTVTGKLLVALTAMVWQGLPRKAAAEHAGISEHGLYKALRKPHVRNTISVSLRYCAPASARETFIG